MIESKYYIPKIEELYVGFEFELNPYDLKNEKYLDKWVKRRLTKNYKLSILNDKYIRDSTIRVQYLNREDIESFLFVVYEIFDNRFIFKHNKGFDLLYTEEESLYIEIINTNGLDIGFSGYCKNKNELKILLKQLDII